MCLLYSMNELSKIELISEAEFKKEARTELVSNDKDPHSFFLNRIQHELEVRKKSVSNIIKLIMSLYYM